MHEDKEYLEIPHRKKSSDRSGTIVVVLIAMLMVSDWIMSAHLELEADESSSLTFDFTHE